MYKYKLLATCYFQALPEIFSCLQPLHLAIHATQDYIMIFGISAISFKDFKPSQVSRLQKDKSIFLIRCLHTAVLQYVNHVQNNFYIYMPQFVASGLALHSDSNEEILHMIPRNKMLSVVNICHSTPT